MLHMGLNNPMELRRFGGGQLESCPTEKDQKVLVDIHLNMSQQCTWVIKKANHILAYVRNSVARRTKTDFLLVYGSGETVS